METPPVPASTDQRAALELQPLLSVGAAAEVEFGSTTAARRLSVLEADRELVDRLMWRQYEGPEWRQFAHALAEYGLQVVRAWIASQVIFQKCRQKGLGALPQQPKRLDEPDAAELALETVAEAIHAFREKVLIPNRWDPTKGASLKTFFIGQCLFQFPNVYRRWLREVRTARRAQLAGIGCGADERSSSTPRRTRGALAHAEESAKSRSARD